VNYKTGDVTLWDAKLHSTARRVQASETFTDPAKRGNAIQEAIEALDANTTLPQKIKDAAIQNLNLKIVKTRTVGFGNAKNSVLLDFP
jgi:hypothetical protein